MICVPLFDGPKSPPGEGTVSFVREPGCGIGRPWAPDQPLGILRFPSQGLVSGWASHVLLFLVVVAVVLKLGVAGDVAMGLGGRYRAQRKLRDQGSPDGRWEVAAPGNRTASR